MLTQKLQEDLTTALKARESAIVSTLRMLLSAAKNKEIEKKTELSDEEYVQLIRKHIKELIDAKELFAKGGRPDLVGQNEEQIAILNKYLPPEISDDELRNEIENLKIQYATTIEQNPKAFIGIAMKNLSSKARPDRIMSAIQSTQTS